MVLGMSIPSSPLGNRVPKITENTGNMSLGLERKHEREAFIMVINGLYHNPSVRLRVKDFMAELLQEEDQKQNSDESDKPVSTLAAIEEIDRVAIIVAHSKISTKKLGQVKQEDPKSISYICTMLLNSSPALSLPTVMSAGRVLTLTWGFRVAEVGDRLKGVTDDQLCTGNGSIVNWAKVDVYACKWTAGALSEIIHKPTATSITPDAELHITQEFEILYNSSDMNATLARGAAKFKICDMFAKDAGPHKVKLASGKQGTQAWARLAARAQVQAEQEQIEHDSKIVKVDTASYLTPQKEKVLATKRAREVLSAREAEKEKKRRFNITTAC